jgi:hypothetical protein
MEIRKSEIEAVVEATREVVELNDLQLALIGGGIGETSL